MEEDLIERRKRVLKELNTKEGFELFLEEASRLVDTGVEEVPYDPVRARYHRELMNEVWR